MPRLPVVEPIDGARITYRDSRHATVAPADWVSARDLQRRLVLRVIEEAGLTGQAYLCGTDPVYIAWRGQQIVDRRASDPSWRHDEWAASGGEVRDDSDMDRRLDNVHFVAYQLGAPVGVLTLYNGVTTTATPGLYTIEAMPMPGIDALNGDATYWDTWVRVLDDFLSNEHLLVGGLRVRLEALRFPERREHTWGTAAGWGMIDGLQQLGHVLTDVHADQSPARLARG